MSVGGLPARAILVFGLPLVVVVAALGAWLYARPTVATDNAYVKSDITLLSSDVAGRVTAVNVRDHGHVNKGDLLIQIDPAPFQLALARADAELDQARMTVETARLLWTEAQLELKEAESRIVFTEQQLARQKQLSARGVAATVKFEEAESLAVAARDRVQVLREKVRRMLAALGGDPKAPIESHALVREKMAARDRVALELAQTAILAPSNGTAVNVKVQPGEQVKAATPIIAIVADTRPWIEANFKETDLTHMLPGQKAKISLDAFPALTWDAEVESVSPATGAEFAILPPQNATGNWVKIVQRLPVRLRINTRPFEPMLRPGMTAHVVIDTGQERRFISMFGRGTASANAPRAR